MKIIEYCLLVKSEKTTEIVNNSEDGRRRKGNIHTVSGLRAEWSGH